MSQIPQLKDCLDNGEHLEIIDAYLGQADYSGHYVHVSASAVYGSLQVMKRIGKVKMCTHCGMIFSEPDI